MVRTWSRYPLKFRRNETFVVHHVEWSTRLNVFEEGPGLTEAELGLGAISIARTSTGYEPLEQVATCLHLDRSQCHLPEPPQEPLESSPSTDLIHNCVGQKATDETLGLPHGGLRPFHQKSTCLTQTT